MAQFIRKDTLNNSQQINNAIYQNVSILNSSYPIREAKNFDQIIQNPKGDSSIFSFSPTHSDSNNLQVIPIETLVHSQVDLENNAECANVTESKSNIGIDANKCRKCGKTFKQLSRHIWRCKKEIKIATNNPSSSTHLNSGSSNQVIPNEVLVHSQVDLENNLECANVTESKSNIGIDANKCRKCGKIFKQLNKHIWRCKKEINSVTDNSLTTSKKAWSYEENHLLLKIYFQANPNVRGYRQRLFQAWKETNLHPNINEQNLSDKVRYLLQNNYFTKVELENLKNEPTNIIPCLNSNGTLNNLNTTEDTDTETINQEETSFGSFRKNEELKIIYPSPMNYLLHSILERINQQHQQYSIINLKKHRKNTNMYKCLQEINQSMTDVTIYNIDMLIKIYQICTEIVWERVSKNESTKSQSNVSNASLRLSKELNDTRKKIGQLIMYQKGKIKNPFTIARIKKEYTNKEKILQACENFKQKAAVLGKKIKKNQKEAKSKIENRLFEDNPSLFLQHAAGKKNIHKEPENFDSENCLSFWKNLWGKTTKSNKSHNAIAISVQNHYATVPQQKDFTISPSLLNKIIRKAANYKAPGLDGIQNVLIKKLVNLHESLREVLNIMLETGTVPPDLVKGRTILIEKKEQREFDPSNYRPITCLSNIWKILSACISDNIYDHLIATESIPIEQKGCIKRTLGTIDQLLIDKSITKYAKQKKLSLHTTWIDFKKAYDSLSHEWIHHCLSLFKISANICKVLLNAFPSFETFINLGDKQIGSVRIKRGIFQGDSLSPLLFVLCLFPLTTLINKEEIGFKFHINNETFQLSHLLFVDDLKIYASSQKDLKNLIHLTEQFGDMVGLEFGFSKCAVAAQKRGKQVPCESIPLKNGIIEELKDAYKYLGTYQDIESNTSVTKDSLRKSYFSKVELICQSSLNSKNLIHAINTLAVPLITYAAIVLQWTKQETTCIDRETRKTLINTKCFHKNSCIHRLYIKRREGGRGLINIQDTMEMIENKMWNNIESRMHNTPPLKLAFTLKKNDNPKPLKTHLESHREKILHGKFLSEVSNPATSFMWLKSPYVTKETESLIFAAQEQCLPTNSYKSKILKQNIPSSCRLCKIHPESIQHILSGCPVLAKNQYIERHNKIGKMIYKAILKRHNITLLDTKSFNPPTVLENDEIKLVWDMPIVTLNKLKANRPDLIYIEKKCKSCQIIDFSLPWDSRTEEKHKEKISKYLPLASEIKYLWGLQNVKVQPIIIGAAGTINNKMKTEYEKLNLPQPMINLQATAVFESCRMLRFLLNIS